MKSKKIMIFILLLILFTLNGCSNKNKGILICEYLDTGIKYDLLIRNSDNLIIYAISSVYIETDGNLDIVKTRENLKNFFNLDYELISSSTEKSVLSSIVDLKTLDKKTADKFGLQEVRFKQEPTLTDIEKEIQEKFPNFKCELKKIGGQ